jgi:hypothetical protein
MSQWFNFPARSPIATENSEAETSLPPWSQLVLYFDLLSLAVLTPKSLFKDPGHPNQSTLGTPKYVHCRQSFRHTIRSQIFIPHGRLKMR